MHAFHQAADLRRHGRDDRTRPHLRQVGRLGYSRHKCRQEHHYDADDSADNPPNSTARQWVRNDAAMCTQVAPESDILHETQRDADRGGAEAVMESHLGLQNAGDQRTYEGAEGDAEVEEGESEPSTFRFADMVRDGRRCVMPAEPASQRTGSVTRICAHPKGCKWTPYWACR